MIQLYHLNLLSLMIVLTQTYSAEEVGKELLKL
ncbi:Uncharacterised protein [Oligella urethralis]|nr:Uncharacterised protein [Oligella urethralis]SUA67723.1 Uncharacterised protein [Oligella urethralis]